MDHLQQPARVDPRNQALLEARFGGKNKVKLFCVKIVRTMSCAVAKLNVPK